MTASSIRTPIICGCTTTLFRDGDTPVYLLSDGRFAAMLFGKWKVCTTVKGLDRVLTAKKPPKPVKVFAIYGRDKPVVSEVIGTRKQGSRRVLITKEGRQLRAAYMPFYFYDADLIRKLERLSKRRAAAADKFDAEYDRLLATARPALGALPHLGD